MKKIILSVIFLLVIGMALGQNELVGELEKTWGEVEGKEVPGFAKTLFGDEKINVYVTKEGGEEIVLGLVTEKGKFKEMKKEGLEKPTLKVYGTEKAIKEIMEAKNPLASFKKALDEDKITYSAVGVGNKIKVGAVGFLVKVAGWFSWGKEEAEEVKGEEKEAEEGEEKEEGEKSTAEKEKAKEEGAEKKAEEKEEGEKREEVKEEITGAVVKETEEVKEEKKKSQTVQMTDRGFGVKEVTVKVGEEVVWENIRRGAISKAMIIGTFNCREIKSKIFKPGESFSWTFKEKGICVITDGIFTTQTMKVVVEE